MTSHSRILPLALVPLLALGALTTPAVASSEYVDAGLGEIPTAVAVSDTGVIAASLFEGKAVALVALDGTVRRASIECSPSDVAIAPDGSTAWAVCQDSEHLTVVDVASLEVSQVSLDTSGLDAIEYLPRVDRLVIGSIQGEVLAIRDVSSSKYFVYLRTTTRDVAPGVGVTQLAPISDGSGAYAITDGGDLLFVSLDFAGQVALIAPRSDRRTFNSIAMGPFDTALYAAVIDYSTADVKNTVEVIDVATGAAQQSVLIELESPAYTTADVTSTSRDLFVALGQYAATPEGRTGLLSIPVDALGRLGSVHAAPVPPSAGAAVAVSADLSRVAFGTTSATAVGAAVDGNPYPAAIRVKARATGAKITVTGTTTSMRPLTALTVHIKDLTKNKARFVKQAKPALINYQGDVTWSGKAPSKRFAIYLSGGGAKSNTVNVTSR